MTTKMNRKGFGLYVGSLATMVLSTATYIVAPDYYESKARENIEVSTSLESLRNAQSGLDKKISLREASPQMLELKERLETIDNQLSSDPHIQGEISAYNDEISRIKINANNIEGGCVGLAGLGFAAALVSMLVYTEPLNNKEQEAIR